MPTDYPLEGRWKAGWAIALHTLKSIPIGDNQFDTTYTDIGAAVNKLKYHGDNSQVKYLAQQAAKFMKTELFVTPYIDVIIPAPPSHQRQIQPVFAIAQRLGKILAKPVDYDYVVKNKDTGELKNVDDPEERSKLLTGAFSVRDQRYRGKKVLLFDDLYRSGATLGAITEVLYEFGQVQNVYVLALTKTRTKR
jgi:predicted amidophosphoribosyltransferase